MPLLECDQRTDQWLAHRRGRITASLAAACLGLNPYTSRAAAWRSIMGVQQQKENRDMRWGTEFEPVARAAYEIESGNLVTETGFWVHPLFDWLGASPDGLVDDDGLVEIKVPTKPPAEIPLYHRVQMTVQMMCTGRKWCDYFAWTHESHFLARMDEPEWSSELLAELGLFYGHFIKTNTEPPPFARGEKGARFEHWR